MDVIRHRYWFLAVSGALVALSWAAIFAFGLRQGIDLRGGTSWELHFVSTRPSHEEIRSFLRDKAGLEKAAVRRLSDGVFNVRMEAVPEEKREYYLNLLEQNLGAIDRESGKFETIGSIIGSQLKQRALGALVLVIAGISVYVTFAFRKASRPIPSWKYGVITLVTLFHDVSIPTGLLSFLGRWKGVEVDTNFIVALLVIMGFSVHDTIIVFDRIREHFIKDQGAKSIKNTINQSVKETIVRSINTSLTLVFMLLTLYFIGPATLQYFTLVILVGVIVGTYSSIFVASPLLYVMQK